jgi:DNA-binding NtrC family response regulator
VDDDEAWLACLTRELSGDHGVVACAEGAEALRLLDGGGFDAVVADLTMPPPDGFDVLRAAQHLMPPPPVIVVSGLDSTRATLEALRLGARDFLMKPASFAAVRQALARVLCDPAGSARSEAEFGLVGGSPAIGRVRRLLPLLASSREAVLVLGETGSGKELFSQALHKLSPRHAGPFIAHNMAATPTELAESLFFGHVRGAFSGASADHAGLFEQAHGGTLFLDEVDSFPLALQAKLLRALESGRVQRVGAAAEIPTDVRLVAASAESLSARVTCGAFRADLYYRLRQLEVTLPALRERGEDVPELVEHFLDEMVREGSPRPRISGGAMEALQAHTWPGNCRELRHALRSAATLAQGGLVLPGHLPPSIVSAAGHGASSGPTALASVEREHILRVLEQARGNQSLAARWLGIDRGTLARKLAGIGRETR